MAAISFLPEPTAQFSRAVQLPDSYQAVYVECRDLLNCSRLSKSRQIFLYYWYLFTVASLDLICFSKSLQLIFAQVSLSLNWRKRYLNRISSQTFDNWISVSDGLQQLPCGTFFSWSFSFDFVPGMKSPHRDLSWPSTYVRTRSGSPELWVQRGLMSFPAAGTAESSSALLLSAHLTFLPSKFPILCRWTMNINMMQIISF